MNPAFRLLAARLSPQNRWLRRSVRSLRTQLIFWNVLALSLLLGGLGVVCRFVAFSFMMQSVDWDLNHSVQMFQHHPPPGPTAIRMDSHIPASPGHPWKDASPLRSPGNDNPFFPRLFYSFGHSEFSREQRAALDMQAFARAQRGETVHTTIVVAGDPVRVVYTPGFDRQDRKGVAQSAYPLKEVYRALSGIDTALLLLLPIGLLSVGLVGVALTNRMLKRMHLMTQAAECVSAVDLTQRLPVIGADEFSELAETFNGLLGRLEQAFQEQKRILQLQQRFTADASHELKTPLTIIKGRADLALGRQTTDERSRHAFKEVDAAAETMSHLVQDLLLLACADEGRMACNQTELLLREIAESAIGQMLREGSAPITLQIEREDLVITGNEAELVRLFRNLLDNAARYTPPDGRITVTACSLPDNVIITIEDTGAGIAPEHLPHLGERFYRVDASRTRPTGGTGLGLAICRGIVAAHGGTLTFESELCKGTKAIIHLPGSPIFTA